MWKSLGGILVNIVPREVPRPETLWACSPLVFWPWNSIGTIFTRIPPRLFHILYQYILLGFHCTLCNAQCRSAWIEIQAKTIITWNIIIRENKNANARIDLQPWRNWMRSCLSETMDFLSQITALYSCQPNKTVKQKVFNLKRNNGHCCGSWRCCWSLGRRPGWPTSSSRVVTNHLVRAPQSGYLGYPR